MKNARIFELSHIFETGMPRYWVLPPLLHTCLYRLGEQVRPGDITIASDLLVTSLHCGTHIDALSHVARMPAGPQDAVGRGGDALPPIIARGRLIDCRPMVESGVEDIGRELIEDLLAKQGTGIAPGDVVLIATGWERHWAAPDVYGGREGRLPGITLDAARFLAESGALAIGADTPTVEASSAALQVHAFLLQEKGVYIMENLRLSELADAGLSSFLFLALPLRIRNATASPIRAVAVAGEACDALLRLLEQALVS